MSLLSLGLDDDDDNDAQVMGAVTPRTNAQAKDALAIATRYLTMAYTKAMALSTTANLRANTLDLLDRNRKYVETLYRNLPTDQNPVTSVDAKKIATALKQTESNVSLVNSVDSTMKQSYLTDLTNSLKAKIAAQIPGGGSGFIGTTLKIVGGALVIGGVGYYLLRRTEKRVFDHVSGDDSSGE